MTRNTFRSIINSGIWTPMLTPALTRMNLSIIYLSLCLAILYKTRGETFQYPRDPTLDHYTALSPLPVLFFLFSFPYSGIPVIISQSVWPDDSGYRNTERAQKYLSIVRVANIHLELSSIWTYFSAVPESCRYDHPVTGNV